MSVQTETMIRKELSAHNCKLRTKPAVIFGKELFSNSLNHQLQFRPIESGTHDAESHLFTQIPKIQNAHYTMGTRIKGLWTLCAFE